MMPASSSLARLQQLFIFSLVVAALAWMVWWWPRQPGWALSGLAACLVAHAPVLALEHVLLRVTWAHDPAPPPRLVEHLRAWGRETWQGLRVFGWRQPFAWRRVPDTLHGAPGQRGIVFIHGFVCNRGFWSPWLEQCRAAGIPCVAVNLEPVHGPIEAYLATVDNAVRALTLAAGQAPVIVAHSMGGLVARAWLRADVANPVRVAHVVTIGTPHHGTWLARFSQLPNGREMRTDSTWLRALPGAQAWPPGLFTCWWSNTDNIVFPPSTATLAGAENRLLRGAGHVDLAFRREVLSETLARVRAL